MQLSTLPVVAGAASGKRIRCTTELKPVVDQLIRASEKCSYWPTIAVRELRALSSGLIGKKNVYVQPGQKDALGNQLFIVFLPGLKAVLQKWAVDEYCIIEMTLDENYFEATSDDNRTGLYRVEPRARNLWATEYVSDGRVLEKDGRIVTVADAGKKNANQVADVTARNIMPTLDPRTKAALRNDGFDLHHTGGSNSLGSLIRYSAFSNNHARASAVLLAETMTNAKTLKNVFWVADHGGSVVLTQAMKILVDRGVTLQDHLVFFQDCKSSPAEATRLAHRLKVTMNESVAHTGMSIRGFVSKCMVAKERHDNPDDPYTMAHLGGSWITGLVKIGGPLGSTAAAAGFLGITGGFFGITVPMLGAVAGALGLVGTGHSLKQYVGKKVRNRRKV